ncbi:hypothetical protein BT63DRAFT_177384 [Microthyrium microscopicum]|uniref:Uncharacterized protein n=1 Tax=Microthyrium microscopicum TaxID=703497 RepID=A0A6A6UJP3_9PEZI|nr:hypothetical protein BT63DRAFT_177384 [Microthyrium microscopicum]
MAFSNGLKSPRDDSSFSTYNTSSPMRTSSSQYVPQLNSSSVERASLHRRFTTNTVPTLNNLSLQSPLSPIGQQRRQAAESGFDLSNSSVQKSQTQFQREYAERIKQSSLHARQEAERLEEEYRRLTSPGHQSEPTTPPDLQDSVLTSNYVSRPNRNSLASLTSPLQPSTNSFHRNTLSGSHHTLGFFSSAQTPGQGLSMSHGNSDEEEEDTYSADLPSVNRRANV